MTNIQSQHADSVCQLIVVPNLAVVRGGPAVRLGDVPVRHLAVHNPMVRCLHAALHRALQVRNRFLEQRRSVLGVARVNALETVGCKGQGGAGSAKIVGDQI